MWGERLESVETMWVLSSYTGKTQKQPTWAFLTSALLKIRVE